MSYSATLHYRGAAPIKAGQHRKRLDEGRTVAEAFSEADLVDLAANGRHKVWFRRADVSLDVPEHIRVDEMTTYMDPEEWEGSAAVVLTVEVDA